MNHTKLLWVRSARGPLGGVCEGLGRSFDMDPWLIRILLILAMLAAGTGIFFYAIAWATFPREDELYNFHQKKLLGVCYRLSAMSGIELGIVRFIAVCLGFSSAGLVLVIYILLSFTLPEKGVDK